LRTSYKKTANVPVHIIPTLFVAIKARLHLSAAKLKTKQRPQYKLQLLHQ